MFDAFVLRFGFAGPPAYQRRSLGLGGVQAALYQSLTMTSSAHDVQSTFIREEALELPPVANQYHLLLEQQAKHS